VSTNEDGCYIISGYKGICTPSKIAMYCTSEGQDSKCDKLPTGEIYNLIKIYIPKNEILGTPLAGYYFTAFVCLLACE